MNNRVGLFGAAGLLAAASAANAGISFSNINISPEFADNVTVIPGENDIDFVFDSSVSIVDGEPQQVIRLTILYEALSDSPLTQDTLVVSILGGLLGAGTLIFNEVIEDLAPPSGQDVTLVDYGVTLTSADDLPHVADLMFLRPATHVKVKKTITLVAPNLTAGIDLAAISLVEQRFVPTPGAVALMGLAGMVGSRRRR